jgi:diguanylate cyclase (GGDEF)-like protein/PAS domain S-box-containing protein
MRLAERVGLQIGGAIANARLFLERQQAEEARKESEAKYYDLYDHAPDMYYSLDLATGVFRECNKTFLRITGYSKEELIGHPIFELYDAGSADDAKKSFQQFPVTGEVHDVERRVKCKDGRIIDVSLNVSAIRDKDGYITHTRSIWHDITERKEQEAVIRALSITDQLTGIYNRRGFTTLAEQQLRVAERTRSGILLLFADVDDLKQINDKLGHKFGDEAIVEVASVLRAVFRKMDIIARMGGDEFAVLAPDASLEYADAIKTRLRDQLDIRNSHAGRDYNLSLSIGMVYHPPPPPSSLDELISTADSLMYEQKRRKKPLET